VGIWIQVREGGVTDEKINIKPSLARVLYDVVVE
jgi:hypothetical protein